MVVGGIVGLRVGWFCHCAAKPVGTDMCAMSRKSGSMYTVFSEDV